MRPARRVRRAAPLPNSVRVSASIRASATVLLLDQACCDNGRAARQTGRAGAASITAGKEGTPTLAAELASTIRDAYRAPRQTLALPGVTLCGDFGRSWASADPENTVGSGCRFSRKPSRPGRWRPQTAVGP